MRGYQLDSISDKKKSNIRNQKVCERMLEITKKIRVM